MDEQQMQRIHLRAGQVFQPATPIKKRELFAGRLNQIARVADAIGQEGLHVAIYGERGVGKTSLANILSEIPLGIKTRNVKVNCDAADSFASVWQKFAAKANGGHEAVLPDNATPHDVLRFLENCKQALVCIFDEFDRMEAEKSAPFSDLIKALSDNAVASTIVVVGVAESVMELVEGHASIERALVQVQMPRMTNEELEEIISKSAKALGVKFTANAKKLVVKLSQGLPHYVHLLGRESVRSAVMQGHASVGVHSVHAGIKSAINDAQETIRSQYFKAVHSPRDDALYGEVLLACAVARKGDGSTFRAGDISKPMSLIQGKRYEIPAFAKHLKAFCEDPDRAKILTRSGKKRNFVYRFSNPLMEAYVLMRGLSEGTITTNQLDDLAG